MRIVKYLVPLILSITLAAPVHAQQRVTVAAASDLVYCLEELNAAFHARNPDIQVVVSVGSSGMFFTQIRHGAPFDIFMSADIDFPRRLIEEGEAVADSMTLYALGRVVLWTNRADLPVESGLPVLRSPAVRYIAIANPEHAPYGRAAKAALESQGIWESVRSKVVYGQNILQTMQFVETGNAEIGIIALSLALAPIVQGKGRYLLLPEQWHPPLEQALVVTRRGSGNAAAQTYLQFLRSAQARAIFEKYGFVVPAQRS